MGFHDVAFLPSRASSSTTCHKNGGRGEGLRTTLLLDKPSFVMLPLTITLVFPR